jgi:serine/threonine protein kinase/tetratricopeptide (TPR) repeat protein
MADAQSPMTPVEFKRIEEIFHAVSARPTSERAACLDTLCGDDESLRAQVVSLLEHTERGDETIDLSDEANELRELIKGAEPLPDAPGTMIGRYKVLQQIGEGGFGVVYMAEQEEPVKRKVALKIIKLGMDTKQVIARFEAERQALAMMDHPNIARVLDAGTVGGRPYFVMELVRGVPITDYCDSRKLRTGERLQLFIDVCHAVQHAHQKGIIHRDLKPSNVLVTLHDDRPVPKVIDFGIAKATSHRLTEKTLFTEFRQFLGTPEYMSPDQADISGLDIDTRTDIYSLGVLLYELLTGATPFDSETLRQAAYGELQRIIREVEPPKPSTRIVTLSESGSDVDSKQRAEAAVLSKLFKGDLDWIVMKALEKDRTRRYQTASELAADIRRHLDNEPVTAGPPSVTYKTRKFISRHRVGVLMSAVMVLALLVGAALATVGFVQARQEAIRSNRIAVALQDVFTSTDQLSMMSSRADVESAVQEARELFGDDHAAVAGMLAGQALQLQSMGSLDAAEKLYRESIAVWSEEDQAANINVGLTLRNLGLTLQLKGDQAGAEQAFRDSLTITNQFDDERCITGAETRGLLASLLMNRGAFLEAETLLREAVDLRRRMAPEQKLQIALQLNSLGNALVMSSQDERAEEVMPELIEAWRDALPADSSLLAQVLIEIGIWSFRGENMEQAEALMREGIEIIHSKSTSNVLLRPIGVQILGSLLEDDGRPEEIVPIASDGVSYLERIGATETLIEEAVGDLAHAAWAVALAPDRPTAGYQAALEAVERCLGYQPDSAAWTNTRGALLYRLERYEQALDTLAVSDAMYSSQPGGPVPADAAFITMAEYRLGRADDARRSYARLCDLMESPDASRQSENRKLFDEVTALLDSTADDSSP